MRKLMKSMNQLSNNQTWNVANGVFALDISKCPSQFLEGYTQAEEHTYNFKRFCRAHLFKERVIHQIT